MAAKPLDQPVSTDPATLAAAVAALSYEDRLRFRDALDAAGVCLKCWDTNCSGWCDYDSPAENYP